MRSRVAAKVAVKAVAGEGVCGPGGALYGCGGNCGAPEPGSLSYHNSAGGVGKGGEVTARREGLGVGEEGKERGGRGGILFLLFLAGKGEGSCD